MHTIRLMFLAVLLVGVCGVTRAQEIALPRESVTVRGIGTVAVKPDIAYLTLGVSTTDKMSGTAIARNARLVGGLVQAIRKAGVVLSDIQTDEYSIEPEYTEKRVVKNGETTTTELFRGYMVSNSVRVTVRDTIRIGKLIDAGAKAGANTRFNIQFALSKPEESQDEALKAAIKSAERKAEVISKTIGEPLFLVAVEQESEPTEQPYRAKGYPAAFDGDTTPIQSGKVNVVMRVILRYALSNRPR